MNDKHNGPIEPVNPADLVATILQPDYQLTVNDLRALARGDIDPMALNTETLAALVDKVKQTHKHTPQEVVFYACLMAMHKIAPHEAAALSKVRRYFRRSAAKQFPTR